MKIDSSSSIELLNLLNTKTCRDLVFEKHIVFKNSHLNGLNLVNRLKSDTVIEFNNCVFNQGYSFEWKIESSFQIENPLKIIFEKCFIKANKENQSFPQNKLLAFKVRNVEFELAFFECLIENLEMEDCAFKSLDLIKCVVLPNDSFIVRDCNITSINLVNCFGTFFVTECNYSSLNIFFHDNSVLLEKNLFTGAINKICSKNNIRYIFFLKTHFHISNCGKIKIKYQKSTQSGLKRADLRSRANNPTKWKYYLTESDLKKLNISFQIQLSFHKDASLKIEDAISRSFYISAKNECSVKINNLASESFFIEDFNTPNAEFSNIKSMGVNSLFQITDSELSGVWFNKLNLKSFSHTNIYHSTIENTRFTATKFPNSIDSIPNIHYPLKRTDDYYNELYENYRQLKSTLLNSGDVVSALFMHQRMYNAICKSNQLEYQDRLILTLNRLTNNHATSIVRAFFLSLTVIIILHFMNMLAMHDAPYEFGWKNFTSFFSATWDTAKYAFKNYQQAFVIANPVHRLSDLTLNLKEGSKLTGGNYAVSFFSRILIAWAFYQFVAAFRKFGKV